MQSLAQDFRYAVRQIVKAPGFAALAVLTLALGIGANTAMFTVVESVMLRPLPYAQADRLIAIKPADAEGFGSTSWLNYRDIRDQAQSLADAAGYSEDVGVVLSKEGSVSVVTPGVTANLFSMLGAQPLIGRTFSRSEGEPGGPKAVILSEGLWRLHFGADQNIIGTAIRVNAQSRTVVGVMRAGFRFPESMGAEIGKGLWLPIQPTGEMSSQRGYHFFFILGQRKPGVTVAQTQAELGTIARRIRETDPNGTRDLAFSAADYRELMTGPVRPVFIALLVAVGLVLLIACANVANLLIARCLGRMQEFAVRSALGAGQFRLVRQLIVEGGLLSVAGCLAGFGLAWAVVLAVHKLPPDTIPRGDDIGMRWSVVLALAGIASLTTLLSSSLPAWLVARTDPQPALQAGSRGTGTRSVRGRLSGGLVAGEVALSVLLLISTGLLFRTLWNLEHARLGFDVTRVTTFTAMPADATGFGNLGVSEQNGHAPASVATLVYQPALERLRQTPGVQDAALVTAPPFSGIDLNSSLTIVGLPNDAEHKYEAKMTAVSGGYARLMSTPVIRGRMIGEDDTAAAPLVLAVNETFARKYFGDQDPVGRQVVLGGKDTGMIQPYTIAGVIGDQVDTAVSAAPKPLIMLPYQQIPVTSLYYPALLKTIVNFAVKTHTDVAVAPAAREVFRQTAPDFALDNFQTMRQSFDQSNFSGRLGLYLTAAFAGLAVLMVITGLYGVLAQLVSYRRREIGVRLALGSTRSAILTMILRQGTALILAGIVVGMLLAAATAKLVKGFLFGVKPLDAWTYVAVLVLLMVVGSIAALVPARRAAAVEPIEALRDE